MLGIAQRLATLRRKPNAEKRVGIVLTNHNTKASRIANAVGLDSPASLIALLHQGTGSWTSVFAVCIAADLTAAALALFVLKPMRRAAAV